MGTNVVLSGLNIANHDIAFEQNVTLLGVDIDHQLKFNSHISTLCRKPARQLKVFKRLRKFLSKNIKFLLYSAFIKCNFNYCPIVWHFCNKTNTRKMEKKYRALRFVTDDYTSPLIDIFDKCNSRFLHVNRMKLMACEVFKIVNKISPDYLQDLIFIKIHRVKSTKYGLKSFRYEAAKVWNSLPNTLRKTVVNMGHLYTTLNVMM